MARTGTPTRTSLAAQVAHTAQVWNMTPHDAYHHLTGRRCPPLAMPDLMDEVNDSRLVDEITAWSTRTHADGEKTPWGEQTMTWYGNLALEAKRETKRLRDEANGR